MTYKEILSFSASALNDQRRAVYTDIVLLPYLNMSLVELSEIFEQNSVPATEELSDVINVPAGTEFLDFTTTPSLPLGLVEIQDVWESDEGLDSFSPMDRRHSLSPKNTDQLSSFSVWSWAGGGLNLYPVIGDKDLKLSYIRTLFPVLNISNVNDDLFIANAATFLWYRTAGLAAEFIGENKTRADSCNNNAILALDRSLGISTKSKQTIVYRKRPFRSNFRGR